MRRVLKWIGVALGSLVALLALLVVLALTGVIGPPEVPAEAIAERVQRDPQLLARAGALPSARAYVGGLTFQPNGSLCGPTSLLNVFRSFGEPIANEEAILAGTGLCRTGICVMGLTLDELAAVAKAHGTRSVTVLRDLSADAFQQHLRKSNDPAYRYVINFHRREIFGAGGGHHSPIGGYLEDEDLVLVLDVNEKFRPWLVERPRLFAAMDTLDGSRKRGLLQLR